MNLLKSILMLIMMYSSFADDHKNCLNVLNEVFNGRVSSKSISSFNQKFFNTSSDKDKIYIFTEYYLEGLIESLPDNIKKDFKILIEKKIYTNFSMKSYVKHKQDLLFINNKNYYHIILSEEYKDEPITALFEILAEIRHNYTANYQGDAALMKEGWINFFTFRTKLYFNKKEDELWLAYHYFHLIKALSYNQRKIVITSLQKIEDNIVLKNTRLESEDISYFFLKQKEILEKANELNLEEFQKYYLSNSDAKSYIFLDIVLKLLAFIVYLTAIVS